MKTAKPATRTEMLQDMATRTGLARKEVTVFFDELANYIKREIGKTGPGIVNLGGLVKIKRVEKPATPERQGRNPRTGETMTIQAKPARTVVKAVALKALKDAVAK